MLEIIHEGYLDKSWTFVQQRCYIRYNHVTGGNLQLPQMCFYNVQLEVIWYLLLKVIELDI